MVKMKTNLRILHLEDNRFDGELVKEILSAQSLVREIVRVDNAADFASALNDGQFDLILSDFTLPSYNGLEALGLAKQKQPNAPFIFVSGTIEEELAVESLKQGAADYVFKNRLSRLGPVVCRALKSVEEQAESRRAEEAMRQSEHKYRQVFETMSDAAFLTDPASGRIVDANKQAELLLQRPRSEIIGSNHSRFHSPEKFPPYCAALNSALAQCAPLDVESEIVRKDGTCVPVEIRANTLILYGRRLMLALCSDLTVRQQTEAQIREQARLLDLVPDAILVRDMSGCIQYWNEGASKIYGWSREEAVGRKVEELLYHDTSEFAAANRDILRNGEWEGELHQVDKQDHELTVHSRWTLVRDEHGKPKSILLVNAVTSTPPSNRIHQFSHYLSPSRER